MGVSSNNNTTYLSILLKSLTKIKSFADCFKKGNSQNPKSKLLNFFYDLINIKKEENVLIKDFIKILKIKISSLNEEDLYKRIFDKLIKELNENNNDDYKSKNSNEDNINNINEYNNTKETILSNNEEINLKEELFFGKKEVAITCLKCGINLKTTIIGILTISYDIKEDFDISNLFQEIIKENNFDCYKCHKKTDHEIKEKIEIPPKILVVILKNNKNNKIKFELTQMINEEQYDLVSIIKDKNEILYKTKDQWENCDVFGKKTNEVKNPDNIINSSTIFFYESKNNEIKNNKKTILNEEQEIKNDYIQAILEYKNFNEYLKGNEEFGKEIILISKEYFKNIFKIINFDINSFNINIEKIDDKDKLIKKLEYININDEKKIQILLNDKYYLNKINNVDDLDEISEIDFLNKEICQNLNIKWEGMFGNLYKISDKIFQFKFKDGIKLNISMNKNKQQISIIDNILEINHENNIEIPKKIKKKEEIIDKNKGKNQNGDKINDKNYINIYKDNIKQKSSNSEKNNENKLKVYHKEISSLIENQINEIKKEIKKNINNDFQFNNYYIINKKLFNRIYNNNNIIKDISNIQNDKNLFNIEFIDFKDNENIPIKYPNDFIIIDKKTFESFLGKLKLNLPFNKENNLYEMILGENNLFIKNKENKEKNNIFFVCRLNNDDTFSVEIILRFYEEKFFKRELKNYIINKGGLEFYLKEKKINVNNKIQKNIDKENENLGDIIIINYKNKTLNDINGNIKESQTKINSKENNNNLINKDNNSPNYINEIKNENQIDSATNINLKNNKIQEKENHIKSNILTPYIRPIILCISKIDKLKNLPEIDKNTLTSLLRKFIININNKKDLPEIENEIENKIMELNKDIIKNLNFTNLIDSILNIIDNELNNNTNKDKKFDFQEYDKSLVYRKFKSFYDKNDSIISQLFYGDYCLTTTFYCCGLEKYQYKLLKYIFLDIQYKENANLKNYIFHWENMTRKVKKDCQMCFLEEQEVSEKKIISKNPEILIVILENKNNCKINHSKEIVLNETGYDLISCIIKSEKQNIFNVVYYENSNWFLLQENHEKQKIEQELETYISFPYILFFKKNNQIIKNKQYNEQIEKNKKEKIESSNYKSPKENKNQFKYLDINDKTQIYMSQNRINNNSDKKNNMDYYLSQNIINNDNNKNFNPLLNQQYNISYNIDNKQYFGTLNCDDSLNANKNKQINIQDLKMANNFLQNNLNNMQNFNLPNMNPIMNMANMSPSMNMNIPNMSPSINMNIPNISPSMNMNMPNINQPMNIENKNDQ